MSYNALMKQVNIIYGTLTGNTQLVAEHIADELRALGEYEVNLYEFFDVTDELMRNCDLLLVGESTWGDFDHNPIGEDFVMSLNAAPPDLKGVKAGFFGLGESHYENFCSAIVKLEELFIGFGAERVGEILKIDGFPDDDVLTDVSEWLKQLLAFDHQKTG